MGWALFFALFLSAGALLYWRGRLARKTPVTRCEYWVFVPEPKLPTDGAMMTRLMQRSPFGRVITPNDALLFSDIRLHLGVASRVKNPHVFRPDLHETHTEPTQEVLEGLSRCEGMVRVRFLSEKPVEGDRHLRFTTHLAEAVAALLGGPVVYDAVGEQLYETEAFVAKIRQDAQATSGAFHVRVVWRPTASGGVALTRGMQKIGLPELHTPESPGDQKVLILELLDRAARSAWDARALPETLEMPAYDDVFIANFTRRSTDEIEVTMSRRAIV